jgi:hypothetical protein
LTVQAESENPADVTTGNPGAGGRGGNVFIGGGIGGRIFNVESNLLGSVAVTLCVNDVYGITPVCKTLASGVDFTLGSDDTPTQKAVTAASLANAIVTTGSFQLNAHVFATSSGAKVLLSKIPPVVYLNISTDQPARISVTSDKDGVAKMVGVLRVDSYTLTQITAIPSDELENGMEIYCSNCDTPVSPGAACSSAGDTAGAWAKRIRGGWACY